MAENKFETIRIYELPETTTLSDSDILIQEDESTTHKFTFSTLIDFIKNHTSMANIFIKKSDINMPSGVVGLDENGKILTNNINFGTESGQVYSGSEGKALETSLNNHILDSDIHISNEEFDNRLLEHYLKSETYSKEEVQSLINTISSLNIIVVDTLPETDISTVALYLVPNNISVNKNVYDEYVYTNGNWEKIGSTQADLSNYYSKTEIDTKLEMFYKEINSSTEPTDIQDGEYWLQEYE